MDMNIAMDVDVDSASGVGKCSTEIKAGVKTIGKLGWGLLFYTDGQKSPLQLDEFK